MYLNRYGPYLSKSFGMNGLVRPHLEHRIYGWGPQQKQGMDLLKWGQKKATEMTRGMEHLCYKYRLRGLGLHSLEQSLADTVLQMFSAWRELKKGEQEGLFTWADSG